MEKTKGLNKLLSEANTDDHVKHMLLTNPRETAKKYGVDLSEEEVDRLSKLAAFRELATELRAGAVVRCDPRICYPADVWLRFEAFRLIRYFVRYFVFYPANLRDSLEQKISRNLSIFPRSHAS
jgi:hypothetical protein